MAKISTRQKTVGAVIELTVEELVELAAAIADQQGATLRRLRNTLASVLTDIRKEGE